MFRLDHDMARRFLYVELRGFWTREVLARFHDEAGLVLQRAIASGATPGEGHILVNANGFPVQDRTIAEEIARFIPALWQVGQTHRGGRIGFFPSAPSGEKADR